MAQINVNNLTFAYEGSYDNIFENVSFQLDTDWKLGFVGRNGRGKTTFLNLLLGKYHYQGKISASIDFEYFPYKVTDPKAITLEVAEEAAPDCQYWQLAKELNLLNVDENVLYRSFETLSKGEQTKVLLAALFLRESSFLLIDEPTNHLDVMGRDLVARYLSAKKGFILVSHDRHFLDSCVDHILAINKADIKVEKGNFSSWQHNKEMNDQYELSKDRRLREDIKRLEAAAAKSTRWSEKIEKTKNGMKVSGLKPDKGHIGAQAAKMMKKAKSAERRKENAATEKTKLLTNIERADPLKLEPLMYHAEVLAELADVSVIYGDKTVLEHINLRINRGDRIALWGPNGCGKSSILKLLKGETAASGELRIGSRLKISYVPQDSSFLRGRLEDYASELEINLSQFLAILRKLDFDRLQFEKDMEDFSMGQKKKVLIAGSLCQCAHLYIWDEPLNYIDVISRMQIEELLKEYEPTMIFVEHDREFCKNVATRIIDLKQ